MSIIKKNIYILFLLFNVTFTSALVRADLEPIRTSCCSPTLPSDLWLLRGPEAMLAVRLRGGYWLVCLLRGPHLPPSVHGLHEPCVSHQLLGACLHDPGLLFAPWLCASLLFFSSIAPISSFITLISSNFCLILPLPLPFCFLIPPLPCPRFPQFL